jgi:hypothetical protein
MALETIGTAFELLAKASRALDAVRERAQTSTDLSLKENISRLYDDFLALKSIIVRITDENAGLERKLADADKPLARPELRQVGKTNHYYLGDEGPFCQPCYSDKGKLNPLTPQQRFGSGIGRKCHVCQGLFIEYDAPQAQAEPPGDWRWQ